MIDELRGLVIKSAGNSYTVRLEDGSDAECHIKGNFRIRGIRSTNPVAVGDHVEVSLTDEGALTAKRSYSEALLQRQQSYSDSGLTGEAGHIGWITDVLDRRNYIIRRATNLSKESHILAANIDQVALLVTVNHPVTSTTFIDRFLATSEAYCVPAILIFNKIDLLTEEETGRLNELRQLYESLGYPTLAISALGLSGISGISGILQGKTTLLSGNSGVGKSTLLNSLFGREMTRTGRISDAHDKGMHTTTFSEMYNLADAKGLADEAGQPAEGWLIDTPGIKGFGSIDMQKEEIGHYFRDIFAFSRECRFSNCTHTNEPGCAVQQAAIEGKIALSRLESYLSLLGDCTESKYR